MSDSRAWPTTCSLSITVNDVAPSGLTYTVEFCPANLAPWTASGTVPVVLADDGVNQIVSVPYPAFIAGKKARFFRISVALAP